MGRFDSFGEYMFDLLFAPLKKGRRVANQFAIFFKVVGREFDDLKAAVFRVRDEANVASASPVMLPVHGQDRIMPRLPGESDEGYRTRLAMKGVIASWAGTVKGIRYALTALGYERSTVEPCFPDAPDCWAEFRVHLSVGASDAVRDIRAVYNEVLKVKEGSSKLQGFSISHDPFCDTLHCGAATAFIVRLPIPEAENDIHFEELLCSGGFAALHARIPVPEL